MRNATAFLMVVVSVGLSGCWSFRKKIAQPLPPLASPAIVIKVPPTPVDVPPEATAPIPIEPPPPPDVTFPKMEVQPEPEEAKPDKPQPKAAAKKPVTPSSPATSSPAPAPDAPESQPEPPPQLGELLSEERRLELRKEIEQSLERARAALNVASRRSLTRAQREAASRVRTFIRQTEEAVARDISTAVQLARRADLLAQDLAVTFQ